MYSYSSLQWRLRGIHLGLNLLSRMVAATWRSRNYLKRGQARSSYKPKNSYCLQIWQETKSHPFSYPRLYRPMPKHNCVWEVPGFCLNSRFHHWVAPYAIRSEKPGRHRDGHLHLSQKDKRCKHWEMFHQLFRTDKFRWAIRLTLPSVQAGNLVGKTDVMPVDMALSWLVNLSCELIHGWIHSLFQVFDVLW